MKSIFSLGINKALLVVFVLFFCENIHSQTANDFAVDAAISVEMGLYQKALQEADSAIFKDPKNFPAYHVRGEAKLRTGDNYGALQDFTKSLVLRPDFAMSYYLRAEAKYRLSDYRGAISDYDNVISLNPNYFLAYYARGLNKLKINDKNGCCLDLSKAGELGMPEAYEAIKEFCK